MTKTASLMKILPLLLLLYCCFDSLAAAETWLPVPRLPELEIDLVNQPLEIETDSNRGATIGFKASAEFKDFNVQIDMTSNYVSLDSQLIFFQPSDFGMSGTVHKWTFSKTNTSLTIICNTTSKTFNDGEPLEYGGTLTLTDTLSRNFTRVEFLPLDTATSRYKSPSTGLWQDMPVKDIVHRPRLYPIQWKTVKRDDRDFTHLTFYTGGTSSVEKVDVQWVHKDYKFYINECNRCNYDTMQSDYANTRFTNVPETDEKLWKLQLYPDKLEIHCNSILVYSYVYTSSQYVNTTCVGCSVWMNLDFKYVMFSELNDNTATEYLAFPECTGLAGDWKGVEVEGGAAGVQFGTEVRVGCVEGYNKTAGSDTMRCVGDTNWEFEEKPICRKECEKCKECKECKKCEECDDCRADTNKLLIYLSIGVGSGFAVAFILAAGLFCACKRRLVKTSKGQSYIVDNIAAPDAQHYELDER